MNLVNNLEAVHADMGAQGNQFQDTVQERGSKNPRQIKEKRPITGFFQNRAKKLRQRRQVARHTLAVIFHMNFLGTIDGFRLT